MPSDPDTAKGVLILSSVLIAVFLVVRWVT